MEAPFVLWLGPTKNLTRFFWPVDAIYPSPRLFLWPYGLRLHAFLIGLSFAYLLCYFEHQYAALLSFTIIIFITPFLLFFIFRIPILQDALKVYEQKIDEQENHKVNKNHDIISRILDSISYFRPSKSHNYSWLRSCGLALWNCLPWPSSSRSLAWRRGSSTEIFIAAAYLEFFQDSPQSGPIPSGLIRWMIYQCWPVWSSYIVLISLTLFCENDQNTTSLISNYLILLQLLWFVFSCLSLISNFFTTKRWMNCHKEDMIKLFPWMKAKSAINYDTYIPLQIQSIKVGIPIIVALFTSIFTASIRILLHHQ